MDLNDKTLNILVTGISGDLGQAIVKSLRLINEPIQIFGCDMNPELGSAFVQEAFSVPAADQSNYLREIVKFCRKNDIHAIIPSSEPEIFALSRAVYEKYVDLDVPVVCQDYRWLNNYGDKMTCYEQLAGKVSLAPFADGNDKDAMDRLVSTNGFPCIVKCRRSCGSKSIRMATNKDELMALTRTTPDPVVQGYINDSLGEFSVGVFACQQFTAAVAFKRDLGPSGNSWYADNTDQDQSVLTYALAIAKTTTLNGSCNIQVRKNESGIQLLEINPRFSSLVAARAICGFKDLEWSLKLSLGLPIEKPPTAYRQLRFRRYFHEIVDFGKGYFGPVQWQPRTKISR